MVLMLATDLDIQLIAWLWQLTSRVANVCTRICLLHVFGTRKPREEAGYPKWPACYIVRFCLLQQRLVISE